MVRSECAGRIKENPIFQTTIDKQSILSNSLFSPFVWPCLRGLPVRGSYVALGGIGVLSCKTFIAGHQCHTIALVVCVFGVVSVLKAHPRLQWKCN